MAFASRSATAVEKRRVFLMFLAIGFGATAFGKGFRVPTSWFASWERIDISVFLLWVVMLGAVPWRAGTPKGET